ncbi:MAG: SDR family oxidoreductase [Blastocatellia bacterium]|nr:SDR family oxidoreductase [Blastocatellia bacterium]
MLLKGKVVLVTGAGQGIGRGIAQAVAEAGADLSLVDVRLASVQETAALVQQTGRRALPLLADVTDGESCRQAIAKTVEFFGQLDGLVNNAGIIKMDSALDITAHDWHRQFDVNVHGLFSCCQLAARQMIAQGTGGAIVNVASNAGKVGYPNMAAYNATKAAVISITRSLANEWAQYRINVNAVCPGGVDTPMLFEVATWLTNRFGGDPHELVKTMKPHQMDRHVQPIEVGRVVAFLLSEHATVIRGQAINCDGGDTPY